MKQELEAIRAKALEAIGGAEKAEDLEALRVQYLGKRGELTAVLKQMASSAQRSAPSSASLPTRCAPSSRRAWRRARRSWPQKRWR